MDHYILKKGDIGKLVEALSSENSLYAPVKKDGVVAFKQVASAEEITFDYENSDVPPKEIFFPQTEVLFNYTLGKKQTIELVNEFPPSVILGIRPCDAKSFVILDKVFADGMQDVYYMGKRNNTTLIGLTCNEPSANCFCTSLGGGPGDTFGLDILLTSFEDEFFVEVISDKGKQLIESQSSLFAKATKTQEKQKDNIKENAVNSIKRHIEVDGIKEKLDNIFDHSLWREVSRECVGCSICTYLCPTCHCFDIQDENFGSEEGQRVRVWDSCSNPEYTLHASGHNPRPGRMNRTRNRIYHKYNYYPINSDVIACVGCGRCINKCPVNIDIIDVLTKIKEV